MDFPVFHVDSIGNRMLIAIVAILHVAINHPLAVGGMPLIATLEWWGRRSGDERCDDIAFRLLRVCFIMTTTVGALTGVGIWFSVSLVNPYAIASLIRVFFWAWFTEWLVFITEVGLILFYYLTWRKWTADRKSKHIRLGYALALFSWITMALIVSILGFMMDPGDWESGGRLQTAILNPVYLPQLAFRTTLAMVQAGFFALLMFSCWRIPEDLRDRLVRFVSTWILFFTPPLLCAALWYREVVPNAMAENFAVAVGTQQGAAWYAWLLGLSLIVALLAGVVAGAGRWRPRALPRWTLAIPFCASLALMAQFERVREFIRKPYVIGEYMYANGIRTQDVAILQRDGLLRHATYSSTRDVLPENRLAAGRDVFQLACSRCHTMHGMNSLTVKFGGLLGSGEWSPDQMASYIENMHGARPFMPPFPGNQSELRALTAYIIEQRRSPTPLHGAQVVGVQLPRERTRNELIREWTKVVEQSNVEADRQEALATLAAIRSPEVVDRFAAWIEAFSVGDWPQELGLDLLLAAERTTPELKDKVDALRTEWEALEEPLQRFRYSLLGGNASRGAAIFQSKACVTCHRIQGVGATVGPDLTAIAARNTREHLLESIVAPRAKIAKGFEAATVIRDNGTTVQGIVREKSEARIVLKLANGDEAIVPIAEVDEMLEGQTMMPLEIWKTMTASELRDLVAYLASLK